MWILFATLGRTTNSQGNFNTRHEQTRLIFWYLDPWSLARFLTAKVVELCSSVSTKKVLNNVVHLDLLIQLVLCWKNRSRYIVMKIIWKIRKYISGVKEKLEQGSKKYLPPPLEYRLKYTFQEKSENYFLVLLNGGKRIPHAKGGSGPKILKS